MAGKPLGKKEEDRFLLHVDHSTKQNGKILTFEVIANVSQVAIVQSGDMHQVCFALVAHYLRERFSNLLASVKCRFLR
jgi:hypothetical protein